MKEDTKETIDYAVKKLDSFFGKVVAEGGELTSEFVAYALLELHINFAIACIVTMIGICCLLFVCIRHQWVTDKLDEGVVIIAGTVLIIGTAGGFIGVLVNGYDMYMSSQYPLMWVISNKVM